MRASSGSSISLKELAEMAKVSTATISRVLNNNGRFSEETRSRVMKLIEETGYSPNLAAKALRTRTAHAIALVIPDIANEFFAEMVDVFGKAFFEKDYSLFVCNAGENPAKNRELLSNLLVKGVDGLIYNSRFPLEFDNLTIPVVVVDRVMPGRPGLATVTSCNEEGGRLAAQSLLKAGSTRPTLMCAKEDLQGLSTIDSRIKGFADVLQENGVAWSRDDIILSPMTIHDGRRCVGEMFRSACTYDGIFATMDLGAIGAIFGIEDAGLRVPEDVNVVGFDDISFAEYCKPSLTTIRQDTVALANAAVEALFAILDGKKTALRCIQVPVQLIERGSTRKNF